MTDTELHETMTTIRNLDAQIAALSATKMLLRESLADHFGRPADKATLDWEDRRVTWHPPSVGEKLDRKKLVIAGVTPAQLAAGTVPVPKKGYIDIRAIGSAEPVE